VQPHKPQRRCVVMLLMLQARSQKNASPRNSKRKLQASYSPSTASDNPNILLVGRSGILHKEIVFPILSPIPARTATIHFGNVFPACGRNRGRGQVYPTGEKSNNTLHASVAGNRQCITLVVCRRFGVEITAPMAPDVSGHRSSLAPPFCGGRWRCPGAVATDSDDPGVGRFRPARMPRSSSKPGAHLRMLAFVRSVWSLAQILLVLKKKQVGEGSAPRRLTPATRY